MKRIEHGPRRRGWRLGRPIVRRRGRRNGRINWLRCSRDAAARLRAQVWARQACRPEVRWRRRNPRINLLRAQGSSPCEQKDSEEYDVCRSVHVARRLRFTLLSWVLPESGSPRLSFYSRDGTRSKSRQPSRRAGRLSVQGRAGKYSVCGQIAFPAESREIVFPGIPVAGRQNRFPGAGNRGSRLHRRGQRARSPGARKQPDQAVQAEIQCAAARRQDVPVHPLHGVREISARVRDAAPGQRRLDLFRAVFSRTASRTGSSISSTRRSAFLPARWT